MKVHLFGYFPSSIRSEIEELLKRSGYEIGEPADAVLMVGTDVASFSKAYAHSVGESPRVICLYGGSISNASMRSAFTFEAFGERVVSDVVNVPIGTASVNDFLDALAVINQRILQK